MKLSGLHLNDCGYYRPGFLITEGYGRVLNYNYDNFQVDPRPKVLLLGRWRHPRTRNNLVAGINLNYLSDDQVTRLRKVLPQILKSRNLRNRYWAGRELLPDIFNDMYRTYDSRYVHGITPATLRFWRPDIEKKKLARAKRKADKQRAIGIEPEPQVAVPEPEVEKPARRVRRVRKPEEPVEPEEPEPEETSKERRARERVEAERKATDRGTRTAREIRQELEDAEEPE